MKLNIDTKMWPLQYEQGEMQTSGMVCVLSSDRSSTMYFDYCEYEEFKMARQFVLEKLAAKFARLKITKDTVDEIIGYLDIELPAEIEADRRAFYNAIQLKNVSFKL